MRRSTKHATGGPAAMFVALTLTAAACTSAVPTTTTVTTTTTSFAPIEIVPVSTTVAPGVVPEVHDQLAALVDELEETTQALRGLGYIQLPAVAIVAPAEFAARAEESAAAEIAEERLDRDEDLYRLLGQYDGTGSLAPALQRVYRGDGAVAFYDGAAAEVVLDASVPEPTPLESSIIVRALADALIDQYHDVTDRLGALEAGGDLDGADALRALAAGDAIAVQLRYLQALGEDDRVAAAQQAAVWEPAAAGDLPDAVRGLLAFPGEVGVPFVDGIVAAGGYAALDAAYDPGPLSTEQVLHPERFAVAEPVRAVPELAVAIDGYSTVAAGTYGEWRLRLLLADAVPPGLLTQTVAGWGGDASQVLVSGDDMVFAYIYGGDSEQDAIEVAQALLALARGPLAAGDGFDSGGGVLWEGERYIFVDRIGDGLKFIVATDSAAGNRARSQMRVP